MIGIFHSIFISRQQLAQILQEAILLEIFKQHAHHARQNRSK